MYSNLRTEPDGRTLPLTRNIWRFESILVKMRINFRVLTLLMCVSFLWGCASEDIKTIPVMDHPATQTPVMLASPEPSATPPIPTATVTPPPSPTIPHATATETSAWSDVPLEICQPGELEIYLAALSPIADQLIILAREVIQLEELPKSRADEILAETIVLKTDLDTLTAPTCLEHAHKNAMDGAIFLETSLNAVLREDFDTARSDLQESISTIVRAVTDIVVMSWELTATSTPAQ